MDRLKSEIRLVLNVHHMVNIILSLAFIASKMTPWICQHLYGHDWGKCSFDTVSCLLWRIYHKRTFSENMRSLSSSV